MTTKMTMEDVRHAARETIRQNGAPGPLASTELQEARAPEPALSSEAREKANKQLEGYSFTVGDDGFFYNHDGKQRSQVFLKFKRGRFEAHGTNGSKLWSGPDVEWFVKKFWYAERVKKEDRGPDAPEMKNFRIHTGPTSVKSYAAALRKARVEVTFEGTEHVYIKWPVGKVEHMDLGRIVSRLKSAHGTNFGIRVQDIKPWPRSPKDGD